MKTPPALEVVPRSLDASRLPDLTFPLIPVGTDGTVPDLRRLLYAGAVLLPIKGVDAEIQAGALGEVIEERLDLVTQIHEVIQGPLVGGGSPWTARAQISHVISFFKWVEASKLSLTLLTLVELYLGWSEHLWLRMTVVKDLEPQSAYTSARITGQVIDGVLGRATPILRRTRIRRSNGLKSPQGTGVDKQNLRETFALGHLLQDICDGLPISVIWGPRKMSIALRTGKEITVGANGKETLPDVQRDSWNVRISKEIAAAYEQDRSIQHGFRRTLLNLRIQAELLMFIGQTGMNLAQAQNFPLHQFSYSSDIDGYKVRAYKARRHGEVLFEIFAEYRDHFTRYLEWRREFFPVSEQRLFPLIRKEGVHQSRRPAFGSIAGACKSAGVRWLPPQTLRGTRVNWMLRQTGDPQLTAEIAQHHEEVLLADYAKPSLQRSIGEITRFNLRHDPMLAAKGIVEAAAPGECDGDPKPSARKPDSAPAPNCRDKSGCLWCDHHRDVDSMDYVWSLACFRHLKIIELSLQRPAFKMRAAKHPADHVVERLKDKIFWFRDSNSTRREWVEESMARIDEGNYHPMWSYLIEPLEGKLS